MQDDAVFGSNFYLNFAEIGFHVSAQLYINSNALHCIFISCTGGSFGERKVIREHRKLSRMGQVLLRFLPAPRVFIELY